jgi:hypothetical protein
LTSNQPRLVAGLLVEPVVYTLNMVERMYWFVNILPLATGIVNHHIRRASFLSWQVLAFHPEPRPKTLLLQTN